MKIAIGLVLLAIAIVCGVFLLQQASVQKLEVTHTIGVDIDHASNVDIPQGGRPPLTLVRTHLKAGYPSEAELGSSADITVTVTQADAVVNKDLDKLTTDDFLKGGADGVRARHYLYSDVAISLSSGSLDWETLDEPKVLQQGTPLPVTLSWSPGTNARGYATVLLSMDVFEVLTKEEIEERERGGPLRFERPSNKKATVSLRFLKVNDTTLVLGQEAVPLKIRVTQYGIFDDVVYWGTLFSGILSFFGAAILLGWFKQLLKWLAGGQRAPGLGPPDPSQGPDI